MRRNSAFTLIELLVVIAIIAVLLVVVVLSLNPAELIRQSRDTNRLSDMETLNHALSVYSVDQSGMPSFTMGTSSVVYVSLPDSSSTCGTWNLSILPAGYTYNCVSSTTLKNTNGTGWIPVPLANTSGGSPVANLPIDPINQSSTRYYYTYTTNGTQFELTANMESKKYEIGGTNDVISGDGGTLATVYEKGSKFGLEPLDYGDPTLVGLWTFDEGSGSIAYDYSGSNATGTLTGNQVSPSNTFYTSGKVGAYAGYFDGTSDRMSRNIGLSPVYNTPAVTVTAWIKPTVGAAMQFVSQNWTYSGLFLKFGLNSDGTCVAQLGLSDHTNATISRTAGTVTSGNWNMVSFTFSGTTLLAYINGFQDANTTSTSAKTLGAGQSEFVLGDQSAAAHAYFNGLLDDVRIYDRALSPAEIQALYTSGK